MPAPSLAVVRRSVFHNVGVVAVGFAFALVGFGVDRLVGLAPIRSLAASVAGWALVAAGFLLRVWATDEFYERRMRVIVLHAQQELVTTGPFRFTRNPLYLGGNVLVFLGASLVLGSPAALVLTALHLPLVDRMIRREERQLAATFGDAWTRYAARVRRWL